MAAMPTLTVTAMVRSDSAPSATALLRLLQLASPALPVGAYSYSEGLEYAVERGVVGDAASLRAWLEDALRDGGPRIEAAILFRAYDACQRKDFETLQYWNAWLTAARESEELRLQNLDMGRALLRLLSDLKPLLSTAEALLARPCNFVVAFAIAAAHWGVTREAAVLGYLQSWSANMVGAGVKLIPLGQTAGQQLLWDLQATIEEAAGAAATMTDDDFAAGNWGHALASMGHETQYSRLFRS